VYSLALASSLVVQVWVLSLHLALSAEECSLSELLHHRLHMPDMAPHIVCTTSLCTCRIVL
jgi:hypothetical protein